MDIEAVKRYYRKQNLDILREEINKPWVLEKISTHLERNPHLNYTVEQVQQEILTNDILASCFIKEPGRQNVSEKFIGDYLSNILFLEDFKILGSSSKVFIIDGQITNQRIVGHKSVDFTWRCGELTFYATQKYTQSKGGAQDNQFHDVVDFIRQADKLSDKKTYVFAIVDGDYYTEYKMEQLRGISQNSHIICCSAEEVERECQKIVNSN